jgi:hypothetical protein
MMERRATDDDERELSSARLHFHREREGSETFIGWLIKGRAIRVKKRRDSPDMLWRQGLLEESQVFIESFLGHSLFSTCQTEALDEDRLGTGNWPLVGAIVELADALTPPRSEVLRQRLLPPAHRRCGGRARPEEGGEGSDTEVSHKRGSRRSRTRKQSLHLRWSRGRQPRLGIGNLAGPIR